MLGSTEEIEKRVCDSYILPNQVVKSIPEPVVTVRTITYQQASYIEQCIQGVLMQKTNFPFEYIIGEDFSTDGTREIVFEYAEKYPEKIRVITADYNVGNANSRRCNRISRGKYIALCEGDDYWTDPYKLQKQVDFLEKNSDYGLVHTDCDFYYQEKQELVRNVTTRLIDSNELIDPDRIKSRQELFIALIEGKIRIRTATVLFRRDLFEKIPPNDRFFLMGDTPLWLDLVQISKVKYINDSTAVYRILSNSVSHSTNKMKNLRFDLSMAEMRVYYCRKYNYPMPEVLKKWYNRTLVQYMLQDRSYVPMFPLIDPTGFLKMKYEMLAAGSFVRAFQNIDAIEELAGRVWRKIRFVFRI